MGWPRLAGVVGVCGVALVLAACGGSAAPAAQPTAEPPPPTAPAAAAPSSVPTVVRAAVSSPAATTASPARNATSTTAAAKQDTVWVGNTDGEGVYLRATPVMADRSKAYADGTPLTIVGDDVDGDGQHWKHVKAPDGTEGYVPAMYTVDTQP